MDEYRWMNIGGCMQVRSALKCPKERELSVRQSFRPRTCIHEAKRGLVVDCRGQRGCATRLSLWMRSRS